MRTALAAQAAAAEENEPDQLANRGLYYSADGTLQTGPGPPIYFNPDGTLHLGSDDGGNSETDDACSATDAAELLDNEGLPGAEIMQHKPDSVTSAELRKYALQLDSSELDLLLQQSLSEDDDVKIILRGAGVEDDPETVAQILAPDHDMSRADFARFYIALDEGARGTLAPYSDDTNG